jgi:hypothetical protein
MPNKEFIELYPLYRKFRVQSLPPTMDSLPKVRINMLCRNCKSRQTFAMTNEYWEVSRVVNTPLPGLISRILYGCTHCQSFERAFFVKFDPDGKWMMKVGQFPAWEIEGDLNLERLLGKHSDYYSKGLICESQGYGIGAFGYYRRIVEEIIDALLDEISHLLAGEDLKKYQEALQQTKQTIVAQDKIVLVKELLPAILRPDGMNPLLVLHSSLSEGLHADSDESCLEYAGACREVLVFLVTQVASSRATSRGFTESMRKILDRKMKPTR